MSAAEPKPTSYLPPSRLLWPLVASALFLAANVVVPLVRGDLYPFTSAPMFRDRPANICNYRVFAPDGSRLPDEAWLVQRVYDGNPVGYGVGKKPPAVLERFGEVLSQEEVTTHIQKQFATGTNQQFPYVEVEQEVVGAQTNGTVGVIRVDRWKVLRSR